jgi:hypothetical protein
MFSAADLQAPLDRIPPVQQPAPPGLTPYTPTAQELGEQAPAAPGKVPYTPTAEELGQAAPGESIFATMTPEDMAKQAKLDPKGFDPIAAFQSLPDAEQSKYYDKAAETFHQLRQTGGLPSAMDMVKNAGKGLWDLVKEGAQLGSRAVFAPVTVPTVLGSNGEPDTSTLSGALAAQEQQQAGEFLAGQKMAGLGIGQMMTKGADWVGRGLHLTKQLKDYSPADKLDAFGAELATRHGMARLVKEGVNAEAAARLEKQGYGLRPEKVEQAASGSPYAWEGAGKIFGTATGMVADSAAPLLATIAGDASPAGVAAAQAALHSLPAEASDLSSRIVGRTIQGLSKGAEKTLEKVEPAIGPISKAGGAVGGIAAAHHLGGPWAIPIGIAEGVAKGGEFGEKLVKGMEWTGSKLDDLSELGKQVATGKDVTSSAAQAARDIAQAAPGALAHVGAGAAMDVALGASTAQTPGERAAVTPFGTVLGGFGALKGAGKRVASGYILAPRNWGSAGAPARPESFAVQYPGLNAEHTEGFAAANQGVQQRLNAVQKYVDGAAPGYQIVYAPKPEAGKADTLPGTLQESGISPDFAAQDAFTDKGKKLIVVRDIEAAPHEARHAMDDVLGASKVEELNATAKKVYADKWDAFKQQYADRVNQAVHGMDTSDPDGTILRETGTGNAAAKEKIVNEARAALPADAPEATVNNEAGKAITDLQQQAQAEGKDLWQHVLTPEEQAHAVDQYVGGEVRAEHHDAWFKAGSPGGMRAAANDVLTALGINPVEGRASTYGAPLTGELVQQARETAGKPVVTPETPAPEGSEAAKQQGVVNAQQAAANASTQPIAGAQQSPREILGVVAEAISRGQGVKLDGLFAPDEPAASLTSDRDVRRQMIEIYRTMSDTTKKLWGKLFFPENVPVTARSGNLQIFGWSPEVLAANAHKAAGALNALAEKGVDIGQLGVKYQLDPVTKSFSDQGWRDLYDDVQKYSGNQKGGRTGAGNQLVVPESVTKAGGYAPPVRGEAAPLDQNSADFINFLFNSRLPDTGIARQGAINLPLNVAGQLVSEATTKAAGAESRVEAPVRPRGEFRGAVAARQGVKGLSINEVNPFRNRFESALQQAGIENPSLIEVNQRLNLKNIKQAQLAPEQGKFGANTLTLQAGFQPPETAGAKRSEVKAAQKEWTDKGTESKYFKGWFGGSKAVNTEGKPELFYHGTTHDFQSFNADKTNPENFSGSGHYFTTDQNDAAVNYHERGPDLNNRIQNLADVLTRDNQTLSVPEAVKQATKQLTGGNPHSVEAYLKMENPVVLDKKGGTQFEYTYDEDTGTEAGTAIDLHDSLLKEAHALGIDGPKLWEEFTSELPNGLEGATAWDFHNALRHSDLPFDNNDPRGRIMNGELFKRVMQDMGYDGVIQNHPAKDFPNMGISADAKHAVVWQPEQVKATSNRGTFNPKDESFNFQAPKSPKDFSDFLDTTDPENYRKTVLDYKGKYGGGQTGMSFDTGAMIKTPEELARLQSARSKFEQLSKAALEAKDFPTAIDAASKAQAAREAIEAATDTGGAGDFIRKYYDPTFEAPMGEGLHSEQVNFQPPIADRRAIRAAAVKDADTGKIFEGPLHFVAHQEMLRAGYKPLDLARHHQGFVTNTPDEFLGRKEALKRARELGQLKSSSDEQTVARQEHLGAISEDVKFQAPKKDEVELRHWSNVPGLKILDPSMHGTGLSGDERARQRDYKDIYVPRTYFGTKDYTKEANLGPEQYRALVKKKNLYPFQEDPKDMWPSPDEVEKAGYAPMDSKAANTLYENKISKAGYEGYIHRDANVVAKFTKTPVRYVGNESKVSFQAPPKGAEAKEWGDLGNEALHPDFRIEAHDGKPPRFSLADLQKAGFKTMGFQDNGSFHDYDNRPVFYKDNTGEFPVTKDGIFAASKAASKAFSEAQKYAYEDLHGPGSFQAPKLPAPKPEEFAHEDTIETALAKPNWMIVTGTQEAQGAHDSPENVANNERLYNELARAGHTPIEVSGSYKGVDQGRNFLVTGISPEEALDWGRKYNQDSVLTPQGLLYSDGSVQPPDATKNKIGKSAEKEDFFSRVENGPAFSLGFDEKVKPEATEQLLGEELGTKKPLSSKQVGDMTKAQLAAHYPESVVPKAKDDLIDSRIEDSPLAKEAGSRQEAVKAFSKKLVDFARKMSKSPGYQAGLKWYSEFVPKLKKVYGKHAAIMAELLAATSPNNAPDTNFGFANDALEGYVSGRFDGIIKKFEEGLEKIADNSWEPWLAKEIKAGNVAKVPGKPSAATFLDHWITTHNLNPRQSNGQLYGMHSVPVLKVFARKWLENTSGPKTQNFVKNLLGTGHGATIDVWADRTMRRLGYADHRARWRILPKNGTGVSDADFAFSQEAFKHAADEMGIEADALQGGLWFAEKQLWADNGWGRLDLGDYRKEIAKVEMLKSGITQRLAAQTAKAKAVQMEQPDLLGNLVSPRP